MTFRRFFSGALLLAASLITLALLAGLAGRLHPAFDSLAHFRVHLAVLLGIVSALLCIQRYWAHGLVGILLACAAYASALGLPGTSLGPRYGIIEARPTAAKTYRLIQLNLLYRNETPQRVIDMLKEQKPDFVTLNEVNDQWADRLASLLNEFPYQARCGRGKPVGGGAVLSRYPLSNSRFTKCSEDGGMSRASFNIGDKTIDVVAIHLGWPWPARQSQQIDRDTAYFSDITPDAILAGDLNATPWSNSVARVSALIGAPVMRPLGGTWLFRGPLGGLRKWLGIPIDHVFAKGAVAVHSLSLGPDVGSDHLPIVAEFSIDDAEENKDSGIVTAAN